jgi:hypothetical protein
VSRVQGRWRTDLLPTLCILAVLVAVACMPFAIAAATWADHMSLRKEWKIAGPACPIVPQVSMAARGAHPPPPFTYKGAHFAFQIGSVECEAVPDDGLFPQTTHPVCQFNAPGAVEVMVGGHTVVYEPGVGRPTTITVRGARPSCVVGGWFR